MKKGMTLVEIMIVVSIIAVLASIAIPNLMRSRYTVQEQAAASSMQEIMGAQAQWREINIAYANSLTDLGTNKYIDNVIATGKRDSYNFTLSGASNTAYYATARAQSNKTASFYIDETGILCRSNSAPGGVIASHKAANSDCPAGYSQIK